jgi:hypothetical protein
MTATPGSIAVATADRTESRIPDYLFAPLRRWRITLVCALVSALAAVAVAQRYGQRVWQAEATVIYTPLSLGGLSPGDYTAPNPQTLISLVKSPQRLQQVIDELELPVSAEALERTLKVNQQANVDAVRLSVEWPDPDVGRAILDRLAESYIRDTVEMRRAKLGEALALLKAERESLLRQRSEARTDARIVELRQTTEKLAACQRKIARTRDALAAAEPPAFAEEGPFRERRQQLLDALRGHEDKLKEIDVEIAAKQAEFDLLEQGRMKGVALPADNAKVKGELGLLKARRGTLVNSAELQQKELDELPRRQARAMLALLEEEQAQLDAGAAALKQGLEADPRAAERVGISAAAEQAVAKRLEQAESQFNAAEARIAAVERLRDAPVAEFAPTHPAAVTAPPRSNKKMLALLVFGGLTSLSLLALVGHAWWKQPRGGRARTCGLPILADAEDGSAPGAARAAMEARRLALQLREPVRQSGGLVLFAPADETVQTEDVVWQLARYLALWDETVVILDARVLEQAESSVGPSDGDPDPGPGEDKSGRRIAAHPADPADWQCFQAPEAESLVQPIGRSGVGYLGARAVFPDPDCFASAAMHGMLVRLAERYDRVLLIAPPLNQSLGAEILAAFADGAVVAFHREGEESSEARRAVGAIRAAGVAWMGALVRSTRRTDRDAELPFALEIRQPAGTPEDGGDGPRESRGAAARAKQLPEEEPSVLSIPWSQAAGFGGYPPGPLKPDATNPPRGAPHAADQHVEGRPDLNGYGHP